MLLQLWHNNGQEDRFPWVLQNRLLCMLIAIIHVPSSQAGKNEAVGFTCLSGKKYWGRWSLSLALRILVLYVGCLFYASSFSPMAKMFSSCDHQESGKLLFFRSTGQGSMSALTSIQTCSLQVQDSLCFLIWIRLKNMKSEAMSSP